MKRLLFMMTMVVMMMININAIAKTKTALFAGGCFWCMEPPFAQTEGVLSVVPGYSGGELKNPTYEQVASGKTGHLEVVQVTYDPQKVGYAELVEVFWRSIDPTDPGGQFADRGSQYRTVIFYQDENEKSIAEASRARLAASGKFSHPIATKIEKATKFYAAEKYHQQYYLKNPVRFQRYEENSGRLGFIRKTWGMKKSETKSQYIKPAKREIKKKLSERQYQVTQCDATEPPFQNKYWDNKQAGIYVDVVSGEPLFSSLDKYDSGTGWPSFSRPLEVNNIIEREDRKFFQTRTEVRSKGADSHLGHVFDDGPTSTGKRFCINSAALRFIPVAELEKKGYGEYLKLFTGKQ